eukprot:Platyproteum_vivax@DN4390_c0_g1_i10.p1
MLALRFSTLKGLCRPVLASGLRTLQPQCARFGTVIEVAPEENRMALKKPTPNQLMSDKLLLQDMTQAGLHVRKVFHNSSAAELYEQALKHNANAWLINTGWVGGGYGEGKRISLKQTRLMIDAIHNGTLAEGEYETMPVFGLQVPKKVEGVPSELLMPSRGWSDQSKYQKSLKHLADLFSKNFAKYADRCSPAVLAAGPK